MVRMQRGQVDAVWEDLADRGLVALCEPVLTETLTITDTKSYARVEQELRDGYPWATVPDNIWPLVGAIWHRTALTRDFRSPTWLWRPLLSGSSSRCCMRTRTSRRSRGSCRSFGSNA